MARIQHHKCTHCHATLPARPNASVLRCEYCGTEVAIHRPQPQQPNVVQVNIGGLAGAGSVGRSPVPKSVFIFAALQFIGLRRLKK